MFRVAKTEDAADLLFVYAPYVRETAITFEYDVPTIPEFSARVRETLIRFPYLVGKGTVILSVMRMPARFIRGGRMLGARRFRCICHKRRAAAGWGNRLSRSWNFC